MGIRLKVIDSIIERRNVVNQEDYTDLINGIDQERNKFPRPHPYDCNCEACLEYDRRDKELSEQRRQYVLARHILDFIPTEAARILAQAKRPEDVTDEWITLQDHALFALLTAEQKQEILDRYHASLGCTCTFGPVAIEGNTCSNCGGVLLPWQMPMEQ